MNQTQKKDILRLIRNTRARFLSLTAIITIGVAFFVGVAGSSYLMGMNTDAYAKEVNFRDITVYSDYGFEDEDIEAIGMISGVKSAEGSKFVDVFASADDTSRIVRVHEYDENDTINRFVLKEGRLPEKSDEVVVEMGTSLFTTYAIGDRVRLSRPDDDLEDYLNVDEVTVVGLIDTPVYLSSTKETSTLANQYLKSYMYIPSSAFSIDIDLEVNVVTEDGQSFYAFSDRYDDYIAEVKDDISNIGIVQAKRRSDAIIADAEKQYEDGLREYEAALEKYNTGIEDGQKQLDDAQTQITDGQAQIASGKTSLTQGQNELNAQYASGKQQIADGRRQLDEAQAQLDQNREELAPALEYVPMLENILNVYDLLGTLEDSDIIQDVIAENPQLQEMITRLESFGIHIDMNQLVGDFKKALEDNVCQILHDNGMEVSNMEDVRTLVATLNDAQQKLTDGQAEINAGRTRLDESEALLESSIAAGQKEIDEGWNEIHSSETQLAQGQIDLENGKVELAAQSEDGKRQLDEAKEKLDKARQDIDDIANNKWVVLDRSQNYGFATYAGSVDQMKAIGNIFPVFFFLVAALVCLTTMTRMIDEQRGQIGILRALGYTKMQCASKYLIYAVSATLIGCILGSVIGTVTFPVIIYQAWRMLYIEPPMHIYIPWHLIAMATAGFVLVMAGTTLYVCNASMNEVPSQLLRPASPKLGKSTFIEHIGFLWNHLSFTWKVTIRNLIRYKRRFIMTVIGVSGCSALMVIGFGIRDSIDQMIRLQFDDIIHFDGSANLSDEITVDQENALITSLQERDDVSEVTFATTYAGIVRYGEQDVTTNMQIFEGDEEISDSFTLRTRRKHVPISMEDGVVISEKMSQDMGVSVGDIISIESRTGVRRDIRITGICEMYIENYAFLSADTYEKLFGVQPQKNTLFVLCEGDSLPVQKILANDERVSSISFMDATIDNFNTMVKALDLIIVVLIISSLALAFVVLGNLMNINISERQREIATLKVLGFRRKEVQSYIYKENNILTLCGAVSGLPLGVALHHWIMKDLQFSYVMYGVDVMPFSLVISVVLTLVFGVIVNQLMKKKLDAIEMVESLKSVE
ncbi:MAG: FtsX-like permease family protein [Bulleidia sp.]